MRPAVSPAGSRITASVSESQTSLSLAADRDEAVARHALRLRAQLALEHLGNGSAHRLLGRDARDPLRGGVPEHDPLVAVDGDDSVGDVAENGNAAPPLQLDLLVQLGLREGDGRVGSQR